MRAKTINNRHTDGWEENSVTSRNSPIIRLCVESIYDSVPLKKLWKTLEKMNIDNNLIKIIKTLYEGMSPRINRINKLFHDFNLIIVLKQGCCLVSILFKIYLG